LANYYHILKISPFEDGIMKMANYKHFFIVYHINYTKGNIIYNHSDINTTESVSGREKLICIKSWVEVLPLYVRFV